MNPNRQPLPDAVADVALLTFADVSALTQFGESWIRDAVKQGRFPTPVYRGNRGTRWLASDVRAWLQERAGRVAA